MNERLTQAPPLDALPKGNKETTPSEHKGLLQEKEVKAAGGGAANLTGADGKYLGAYLRSSTMLAGFSRYSLHRLEKRHIVAPSMMR